MKFWTEQEISLLNTLLNQPPISAYETFQAALNSDRSYDSIQKKMKQLRELNSILQIESELISIMPNEIIEPRIIPGPGILAPRNEPEVQEWLDEVIAIGRNLTPTAPVTTETDDGVSLCILISDTHVGKLTPYYNMEIAESRFASIPAKIMETESHEDIREIILMIAGDIVEGEDIYANQSAHVEASTLDQIQVATRSIWSLIVHLTAMFNVPVKVKTVPGNHGRSSKNVHEKTNWDNVVYFTLSTMANMADNPMIEVDACYDEFNVFQVQDQIGLMYHHGVKHTGTPATRVKIAGWIATYGFNFMVHAHWHEWKVGTWLDRTVHCNGAMCGSDDLSRRMAVEGAATQSFFKIRANRDPYGFTKLVW